MSKSNQLSVRSRIERIRPRTRRITSGALPIDDGPPPLTSREVSRAYALMGRDELNEYEVYENTITIPAPLEYEEFACDLLYREDYSGLVKAAKFGGNTMRKAAWQRVARSGDSVELLDLSGQVGRVSPNWMGDYHELYDVPTLQETLRLNRLSLLDNSDIAYRVTGDLKFYRAPDGASLATWIGMRRPAVNVAGFTSLDSFAINLIQNSPELWSDEYLEAADPAALTLAIHSPNLLSHLRIDNVLAGCVTAVDREFRRPPRSMLTDSQLRSLAATYSLDETNVLHLMRILTLEEKNEGEIYFFNVTWIEQYAPWLILTSSFEAVLGLALYPVPFEIIMRAGDQVIKKRLKERLEPTRAALALLYD